ncbi:MAG TPA: acyl-CoA thioesterase domain-containing protein, partial [Solirubrobacterales bacterium]|nr:acyl-CoA thioesterase domain-containing protein [Solirubrobacterales bacterium]
MPAAFYESDGVNSFVATELTRGPWDPQAQHAGPPSALLGREIERADGAGADGFQVARVTLEILRPVPIGPVRVEAEVVRPGRSVQMVEATLSGEGGKL